ncbi:MAG TPA: hypothetical protein VNG53_11010 [Bacteroidia bacterium]|nr:hypothetical protein [Bacteroidia bacterium]
MAKAVAKKQTSKVSKNKNASSAGTIFESIEKWLVKRDKKLFFVILFLCLVFSVLLFQARISEGGDDSNYIEAGFKYSQHFFGYFYTYNAPLYPLFLSLPISIFGVKLELLKSLSVIFNLLSLVFFYKALHKRIPAFIFFPVFFITAINAYFLFYASQTYNEAFFLFLQSLFLYCFVNLLDAISEHGENLKLTYKKWLVVGFILLLLTLAKNVAIAALGVMIVFFLMEKQNRNALYSVGAFLIFEIPFAFLKFLLWGKIGQYGSQGDLLMLKDPYNPALGKENLYGFITRFFQNSNIYLSKRFFQILGMRSDDSTNLNGWLAFFVIILLLFGLYRIYKSKHKILLFVALYTAAVMVVSFVALQTRWDQPRIIMILVPMMLIVIFYGIYNTFSKSSSPVQTIYFYIVIGICISGFVASWNKASDNIPILEKNMSGDIYYGYTPDWVNYLRMSAWCGKNLPKNSYVACRKAPMSFIYANGMEFFPVYSVPTSDPDSVLAYCKRNKVTHVILASLRRNSKIADPNAIINTVWRMFQPVAQKYPNKLKLIHQEGNAEPAYLYQIIY